MSSLENLDMAGRPGMTITGYHRSRNLSRVMILNRFRHRGNRLAGADNNGPALWRRRQALRNTSRRIRRGNGGVKNAAQQCLRSLVHLFHAVMLWCATAMINRC